MRKILKLCAIFLFFASSILILPNFINSARGQSVLQSTYNDILDRETRISLQYYLMWAGFYNATLDGDIGPKTINAIKKFQASYGLPQDGILSDGLVRELRSVADNAREKAGFAIILDEQSGVKLGVPLSFVQAGEVTSRGTRWKNQKKKTWKLKPFVFLNSVRL